MAPMIPIASQEKFDSISPVRSNGLAINMELQYYGSNGGDSDRLQSRRLKQGSNSCATSIAHSSHSNSNSSGDSGSGRGTGDDDVVFNRRLLPAEAPKTLLCLVLLLAVFVANLLSIAIIHDHTPTTKQDANRSHPPLRDITYDVVAAASWWPSSFRQHRLLLTRVAELAVIVTSAYVLGAVVLLHPQRSIVFRRLCFLLALLFSARLLTMSVTLLPVSSASLYQCASKERSLVLGVVASRLVDLVSHLGLLVDGELRYCGNYVFSGHAVLLVLNCLWVDEYGSARRTLCRLLTKVVAACSLLALVATGFDYTISIITAYYATTRLFWIYHTMANHESLKRPDPVNQVCKEWWYRIFLYLEGNVRCVVSTPNSN